MSLVEESFDKEKAKSEIKILVEKYEREKSNGKLESYSEEQTKNDFILRLFKALGWDVYNDHSNTLTAEEKASRGRVDYGFRINEIPKFFLEAKSFRAGVNKDEYAFQSINYSWLKGCTWAVLTNFEKLIIFNAEWKEKLAGNCLFISLNHTDFLTSFDQLYLLSREAFVKNLLDKEAEKWHKKIKKTPIDQQLLQDLTKFREMLTQSIMRRNESLRLTEEDLDEVVQKILDRIIFIRTVEDRQIEPPHLRPLIREDHKGNLWKKVAELYRYFDDTYDSNLFSPHECEKLIIGDQELETIIRGLHETEDGSVQYDFGAINVDVLGNVYEQYLGHILKKTKKGATIQNGATKRKEQGIFYTPTYIVDYIVKNTVGSKIAEMGMDWKKIRILDPACGSGSFLIKAFDYLTLQDKELERKEEMKKDLYGTHIATERFGYLKNNIFGVDLDTKAVEIAQLNLMIRATEKKERLPSLQQNIKNGNSLIDDKNISGNHAFKWETEFQEILKTGGGFDVIIGNPPYVRNTSLSEIEKEYFSKFESAQKQYDLYILFIEQGIQKLRDGGYLGFIIPNKILSADYAIKLREVILRDCNILKIVDVSDMEVFKSADTYPVIIILRKGHSKSPNVVQILKCDTEEDLNENPDYEIPQSAFSINGGFVFSIHADKKSDEVLKKIDSKSILLGTLYEVRKGIETGDDKKLTLISENKPSDPKARPVLGANTIRRYSINWNNRYVIYDKNLLNGARKTEYFEREKIVTGRTVKRLSFALDENNFYTLDTTQTMYPKEQINQFIVLGLINSKLINFYYSMKFQDSHMKGGYFRCYTNYLEKIPLHKGILSQDNSEDLLKEQQDLISLTQKMYELNEQLQKIGDKKTNERMKIDEEINRIDSEIDELVYKIYGLDDAERKIVEASIK